MVVDRLGLLNMYVLTKRQEEKLSAREEGNCDTREFWFTAIRHVLLLRGYSG